MKTQQQKILSYVLIVLSLFILLLFTKEFLLDMQSNLDLQSSKTQNLLDKTKKLKDLQAIKNDIKKKGNKELEKYKNIPTEDKIVKYMYSMIEEGNKPKIINGKILPSGKGNATIKSLSITPAKKNELGFLESDITLNLSIEREAKLKNILDTLVSEEAEYKFFISSFSYNKPELRLSDAGKPVYDTITVTIPLKVFYK